MRPQYRADRTRLHPYRRDRDRLSVVDQIASPATNSTSSTNAPRRPRPSSPAFAPRSRPSAPHTSATPSIASSACSTSRRREHAPGTRSVQLELEPKSRCKVTNPLRSGWPQPDPYGPAGLHRSRTARFGECWTPANPEVPPLPHKLSVPPDNLTNGHLQPEGDIDQPSRGVGPPRTMDQGAT